MINDILKDTENRMNLSIESLRTELSRIRTGKANISLLDGITVPYYGTPTPLNQVANISAPEPRLLTVQPWDKAIIGEIEKALQASDLGITPNNDGTVIRLPLPQLTQEVREDLAKQARKRGEDAKVSVRNIRRDANDQIKKLEKAKEIPEDDSKSGQDDVQKLTDDAIKQVDSVVAEKEKEVLEF
ncbi:ribosome recycling factor [Peptococcus niger]|uniref:Ribosome-recycling factor n=1 Tax=Peptococcus niger TaxID=2741 RepID=A0A1G6YLD4_PEPNI|nr:ribosome recycling factor [Peptococcus niger]SDD90783.1 ribosome recycling factor [Peptococcus niger]